MAIRPLMISVILLTATLAGPPATAGEGKRPNVLFFIAEDQSWMHVGAYGNKAVNTPAFDRLASEGVLFKHAYTACPSCTGSRNAILTGQALYRLEEAGVFGCTLPRKFPVFPLLLEKAGYQIGWTGKSWGPGDLRAGGWGKQHPVGKKYSAKRKNKSPLVISGKDYAAGFEAFLDAKPADRPFFFWCGTSESHRGFRKGSGLKAGKKLADCGLPGHFPDTPEIRSDILDYCVEIDYLDWQLGLFIKLLQSRGELENTLIIVTSDHGMPFPRAKANLYDVGTRVPLAIYWKPKVPAGRVLDDFVSLSDVAPTILEAAGVAVPKVMSGRSLMDVLRSNKSGLVDPRRDSVVLAHERHSHYRKGGYGYPVRAIRTHSHAYIRNYAPDRWAAGDPDIPGYYRDGYGDIDKSPTKTWMIQHVNDPKLADLIKLSLGKRPAEELYDMKSDPWQLHNLAEDSQYATVKQRLRTELDRHLSETGDPRSRGQSPWDNYPCLYGPVKWFPPKDRSVVNPAKP